MRVECPHCGRAGNVADNMPPTAMIRCPQCENKFRPVPAYEAVMVATAAAPAVKDCDYCGESILVTAKKCKHCGEVLDVALREAREAKSGRHAHQPVIINNNVSSSASAAATAVVGGVAYRKSLLRSFLRFTVICALLFIGGMIYASANATGGKLDPGGSVVAGLGMLMFLVGLPIYLIRGVWRILFG